MTRRKYNIELVLANVLFGISYSVIVSLVEKELSARLLFAIIVVVGAVIFIPHLFLNGDLKRIRRSSIPRIITSAIILLYGWSLLTLIGGKSTSAINIAAISTLGPSVTMLAAAIESRRGVALMSTLVAATIATLTHFVSPPHTFATTLVACGVVCVAISTVIVERPHRRVATTTLLGCYFAVGLLLLPLLLPHAIGQLWRIGQLPLTPLTIAGLIYLPTMGMALPLYLLYRGSRELTPLHTALYRYIQPIIALVVLILSSSTTPQLIGEIHHLATTLVITASPLLFFALIERYYKNIFHNK